MFTGIIETLGEVKSVTPSGSNIHIEVEASIAEELKIDQSVAHNGVCLTVVSLNIERSTYVVTAIAETLQKSNLGELNPGNKINLERCVQSGGRLDGHIVQGHVDTIAKCLSVEEVDGSWRYKFKLQQSHGGLIVPKGSITVNGVSLTVTECTSDEFQVAIIPYTYEHTQFHELKTGNTVNIEFDILGKYVMSIMEHRL